MQHYCTKIDLQLNNHRNDIRNLNYINHLIKNTEPTPDIRTFPFQPKSFSKQYNRQSSNSTVNTCVPVEDFKGYVFCLLVLYFVNLLEATAPSCTYSVPLEDPILDDNTTTEEVQGTLSIS